MMKELLCRGLPVQFRSTGRSLEPLVFSGDVCFLWPILSGKTEILPGDIVFCEVQPNGRFYCHLVWNKGMYPTQSGTEKEYYVIGNNKEGGKRRMNGWCYNEHSYGILVKTQRGAYHRPPQ